MKTDKKYALGISYGHHESSVCLTTEDGQWVALREECLSRVKGDYRFPVKSALYLLRSQGVGLSQITGVCLHEKPLRTWLGHGFTKGLSADHYRLKAQHLRSGNLSFEAQAKSIFKVESKQFHYANHYVSHYLNAKAFSKSLGRHYCLVLDGYGEGASGAIFVGDEISWRELRRFQVNQSFGLLYAALTDWAGYNGNADEHKVMALAAYGEPIHRDFIRKHVICGSGAAFEVNKHYFNFDDVTQSGYTSAFCKVFGEQNDRSIYSDAFSAISKGVADVIASFQTVIAECVNEIIREILIDASPDTTLLLSGGLFLNVKLVSEITRENPNNRIIVPPSPGDAGSAIGAAYFLSAKFGWPFQSRDDAFCGPKLEPLSDYPHLFERLKLEDTTALMVKQLSFGYAVAVYQGYAECGPRSLGVRSLLASLETTDSVRRLNEITKKRERFRPIAPLFSLNSLSALSSIDDNDIILSRWMGTLVHVDQIVGQSSAVLANTAHRDGSMRAQITSDLEMKNAGIHVAVRNIVDSGTALGNTSLNIAGDPTVFTPLDLYINLRRMGLKGVFADDGYYTVQ